MGRLKKDSTIDNFPCPDWLNETGKEMFNKLIPVLENKGFLENVYWSDYCLLCNAWGILIDNMRVLNEEKVYKQTIKGQNNYKRHEVLPEVGIVREYTNIVKDLGSKFGFSPADMAKLKLDEDAGKPDAFDLYLKQKEERRKQKQNEVKK